MCVHTKALQPVQLQACPWAVAGGGVGGAARRRLPCTRRRVLRCPLAGPQSALTRLTVGDVAYHPRAIDPIKNRAKRCPVQALALAC